MKKEVDGFDWDIGNSKKCQKHGLSLAEIEEFFRGRIQTIVDAAHSITEDRHIAVGYSASGRPMLVGFTYRTRDGQLFLRPISARFMHEKERRRYEETTP